MIDKSKLKEQARQLPPGPQAAIHELLAELESARNAALEEAAKVCEVECVHSTSSEAESYNLAIDHCAAAIRSLATTTSTEQETDVQWAARHLMPFAGRWAGTDPKGQDSHVMPPFAAPAGQHKAGLSAADLDKLEELAGELSRLNQLNPSHFSLLREVAHGTLKLIAASRGAAQGRITSDNGAADVSRLQVSGTVCEIGDLEDENGSPGVVLKRMGGFVTIKGLEREEVAALGPCFMDEITISFGGASPAPSAKQEPSDQTLAYESALEGFISVLGIEESGSVLDDSKAALDKLNGILAAPSASASPAAPARPLLHTAGADCMSEDECIAAGVRFADYERGVSDAIEACQRRVAASPAAPTDQQIIDCFTKAGWWMGIKDTEIAQQVKAVRLALESFGTAPVAGSQQVTEEWQVVPKVPTDKMAAAAIGASLRDPEVLNGLPQYAAMLAAAPAVPVPAEPQPNMTGEQVQAMLHDVAAKLGMTVKVCATVASGDLNRDSMYCLLAAPSLQQGKEGSQP